MKREKKKIRRGERGMTLLEIMVVITILGLIAGAITVAVLPSLGEAKRKRAQVDIKAIENALDLFKVDNGRYPRTDEGLQSLVTERKLKALVKDPWNNDYIYLSPGVQNSEYDITTYGADGRPGGDGEDADITN